jgi:GT2 family glycosyltransferase
MKMVVLVVLYKKRVSESETIQSLLNCINKEDLYKIILWDNSPFPLQTSEIGLLTHSFSSFEYKHTPENISLAKIYNITIKENFNSELLMLFDQDSVITISYFELLKKGINENPKINLFVPLVKNGDQVVSPGDFAFINGKYWHNERSGIVESKNKLAITSGMVIRMSYLLSNSFIGFDERLKLYGIDTQFMIQYQKCNSNFFVINYVLKHNLSLYENEDISTKIKRFRDHKFSLRIIMKSTTILQIIVLELVLFVKSFFLAVKNRNIYFLK